MHANRLCVLVAKRLWLHSVTVLLLLLIIFNYIHDVYFNFNFLLFVLMAYVELYKQVFQHRYYV